MIYNISELWHSAGVDVPEVDGQVPVRRRPLPTGRRRVGRAQGHPHGEVRHDERHVRAQGTDAQPNLSSGFELFSVAGFRFN